MPPHRASRAKPEKLALSVATDVPRHSCPMTNSETPALSGRRLPASARWAAPAIAAAGVAIAILAPGLTGAGATELPDVTPAELVASIAEAEPTPLSGTVVYTARLGLPEIPFSSGLPADPIALLDGTSTLRVWTDGADRSRVSLLGAASEYSVVHDGPQAWTYSSSDNETVHYTLAPEDAERFAEVEERMRLGGIDGELPTPDEAARRLLGEVDEFSTITLDEHATVAGRSAYQLVVTPDDSQTLVARIEVAVDAETSVPLRLRAWGIDDDASPSLEVGFTDIDYGEPSDSVLTFSAPADSAVQEKVVPLPTHQEQSLAHGELPQGELPDGVEVFGVGWETVVQVSDVDIDGLLAADPDALTSLPGGELTIGSPRAQELIEEFVPRDGSGQHGVPQLDLAALLDQASTETAEGTLISTTLASVLITPDGRVLIGAVPPEALLALA